MRKYLVSVPILARMEVVVDVEDEDDILILAEQEASAQNLDFINKKTINPLSSKDTPKEAVSKVLEFGINEGYKILDFEKRLISVPILAKMEITVEAENEEEAKVSAEKIAKKQDVNLINHELLEPVYITDSITERTESLIKFGANNGYQVWDYEKEFGI